MKLIVSRNALLPRGSSFILLWKIMRLTVFFLFITVLHVCAKTYSQRISVKSGIYTSDKAINLYTEGKGAYHPVTKSYSVNSFPSPMLIGPDQKIILWGDSGLRYVDHTGKGLIATLNKILNK